MIEVKIIKRNHSVDPNSNKTVPKTAAKTISSMGDKMISEITKSIEATNFFFLAMNVTSFSATIEHYKLVALLLNR